MKLVSPSTTLLIKKLSRNVQILRKLTQLVTVLGIETSCDDTSVAIVNDRREILAETSQSRLNVYNSLGGICPILASDQHRDWIDSLVAETVTMANVRLADLDAVAVTINPGLVICLKVGVSKALSICHSNRLPLIPIHHMRAHALTLRLTNDSIHFPYLCFLMSGGHCQLTLVNDPEDFLLLGEAISTAPGEALDKIARALNLSKIVEFAGISGGKAIEILAARAPSGGHLKYRLKKHPYNKPGLDMCFSGLRSYFTVLAKKLVETDKDFDLVSFCASVQHVIYKILAKRVQKCIEILDAKGMMPEKDGPSARTLVLSGGVACNSLIRKGLTHLCHRYHYRLVCPDAKYCCDNAAMIAWNGLEMLAVQSPDIIPHRLLPRSIYVRDRLPIGRDMRREMASMYCRTEDDIDLDDITAFI